MGTIRNIIIDAALGALVVAFILFWVFAGMGMQEISLCTAFLVYVFAVVFLFVGRQEKQSGKAVSQSLYGIKENCTFASEKIIIPRIQNCI